MKVQGRGSKLTGNGQGKNGDAIYMFFSFLIVFFLFFSEKIRDYCMHKTAYEHYISVFPI